MLYQQVLEVVERVAADGTVLKSMTREEEMRLSLALQEPYASGIWRCAIAFIHGYRYLANGRRVAELASLN
jgi:5-oxoprolinase (ATP-hydrolysing)